MARRTFIHIGTPKSGTTYLQSLWWQHRDELARRGLLLPGDADSQFQASVVVRAHQDLLDTMGPRQRGAFDRLVDEAATWDGDVLFTQEQLVEASATDAQAAVARLAEVSDEVHVIVTARDLARQVPSAWQQRVKHGSPTTLLRFCQRVAKDDPDFNFWRHQDIPRILERWGRGLPAERVHVVVLPQSGGDRSLLWRYLTELLGFDDTDLSLDAPVANETLAPAEIAFHRLVNAHFDNAHLDVAASRRIKSFMEPRLGGSAPHARLAMSPEMHAWVADRGARMADELAGSPWHVVGDLDDLRPDPERVEGIDPDTLPDADVLAVAEGFLASELLRRASSSPEAASATTPPPGAVSEAPSGRSKRAPLTALRHAVRRHTRQR